MNAGEFTKGIVRENPVFVLALGLCPALAVTNSVQNAAGMGLAASFVLLCSNLFISLIKGFIPSRIRIPCYIVVIASFVVLVELYLGAYQPALDKSLGLFVPLIVVNCVILGRAEAFASRKGIASSIWDALGMGLGFTLALVATAVVREVLGNGTLWNRAILSNMRPALIMILPPGALLSLGLLMAAFNWIRERGTS